jgi:hypothetical protein
LSQARPGQDDFEQAAVATFRRAGIDVSQADLELVRLLHDGLFVQLGTLDGADPVTFPFEPIDPSRRPEPR